jgi:hypothetical protein
VLHRPEPPSPAAGHMAQLHQRAPGAGGRPHVGRAGPRQGAGLGRLSPQAGRRSAAGAPLYHPM